MDGIIQAVARKFLVQKHGPIEAVDLIVFLDTVSIRPKLVFTDPGIQFLAHRSFALNRPTPVEIMQG
jgi:hypothetical protein